MKKFALGAFALTTTATAMAQDTNAGLLDGLLAGGTVGVVLLAIIVFVGWRFFFSGGSD